jgi:CRP/FNR family transcriptional regulator, cyclic AMP receptor protein
MPIDAAILGEIEHLRELSAGDRVALAEKIELMRYDAGQTIFNLGDPGHALYIIRSGEVEIYVKNDQGEKIVLETARPGDIFGEVSLLDDGPRTAWVTAISAVEVLRLDRAHFEDYVRQHTPAALNLLSVAARRLRKSDEFIRSTITRNVNDVAEERQTALTRIAESVPAMMGTLPSTLLHAVFFAGWIAINLGIAVRSLPVRSSIGDHFTGGDFPDAVRADQPEPAAGAGAHPGRHRVRNQHQYGGEDCAAAREGG